MFSEAQPLRRKLILAALLANGLAFVLIAGFLVAQEYAGYRERAQISLAAYASVVAGNIAPALMFADDTAATEILASLAVEPAIVHAELHNRNGLRIAAYSRPGSVIAAGLPAPGSAQFVGGQLLLGRFVEADGQRLGVLYLQADQGSALADVTRRLLLVGLMLTAAFCLASFLFLRLLKRVVRPVQDLAGAMQRVVRDGDYNARVVAQGGDELAMLATGFNQMLAAIREREAALAAHQSGLEAMVAERTEALRQLNASLEDRVRAEVAKNRDKDHLLIQQSRLAAMGEMIGNIAHQWRQPINALGLLLANIRDAWDYGEIDAAWLEREEAKGQAIIRRMSTTIDDFRNFFRPDKERVCFDVGDAVDEGLRILEAALRNNRIDVAVARFGDLHAWGYPNEFSQVVLNLLANAKDALVQRQRPAGQIRIDIRQQGDLVCVNIEDDAGGIAADVLPRIFDPYFTTKEGGTGIGLYMCKTIVEGSMGGRITAANGAQGALFSLLLPGCAQDVLAAAPHEERPGNDARVST